MTDSGQQSLLPGSKLTDSNQQSVLPGSWLTDSNQQSLLPGDRSKVNDEPPLPLGCKRSLVSLVIIYLLNEITKLELVRQNKKEIEIQAL